MRDLIKIKVIIIIYPKTFIYLTINKYKEKSFKNKRKNKKL